MEIRYLSTSHPWSEYKKSWGLEMDNKAHVVQYNVQPGDVTGMIFRDEDGVNHISTCRWGKSIADTVLMFNARTEGIFAQNAFRFSIRERRCLIPIDSFYMVIKHPAEGVNAYRIKPHQEKPLLAAAVYDENSTYFSLLTKKVHSPIGDFCDRSPVLIHNAEELDLWLGSSEVKELDEFLQFNKSMWDFSLITSDIVNNVNSPILHVSRHKDLTLFD